MEISNQILKELNLYDKHKMYVVINGEYWEYKYNFRVGDYTSSRVSSVSAKISHVKRDDGNGQTVSKQIVNFCYVNSNREEIITENC